MKETSNFGPCICEYHRVKPYRSLTTLILDCWARNYDNRPYSTLLLNRKQFQYDMHRCMDNNDFDVLLQFLAERKDQINNFALIYVSIPDGHVTPLAEAVRQMINVSLCHVDITAKLLLCLCVGDSYIATLRLTGNPFTMELAKHLRTFLLKSKTLQYLDLGYCSLTHDLFAVIADGVIHCKNLKGIDFSQIIPSNLHHRLDRPKIGQIIAIIIWRQTIIEGHFKHCDLDGHDIEPICEYLSAPVALTYLDLGSNNIGAHGTLVLFKALKEKSHLIGLDISNNNIGAHGGEIIAHHLPFTRIRFLDIGRNSIPAKMIEFILKTLNKTNPLRILNIVGNQFDYTVGEVFKRQENSDILLMNTTDVCVTFDKDENGFRIIPRSNDLAEYNQRYHRVVPFSRKYDICGTLKWNTLSTDENKEKLLINQMFVDPIFVDKCGKIVPIQSPCYQRTRKRQTYIIQEHL